MTRFSLCSLENSNINELGNGRGYSVHAEDLATLRRRKWFSKTIEDFENDLPKMLSCWGNPDFLDDQY